jgi:hypothetical protein
MLRRIALGIGLLGVIGASVSGCGGGGGGGGTGIITGATLPLLNGGTSFFVPAIPATMASRAACAANPTKGGVPRWTVMVYMNASNDLQPFSLLNVAQMVAVGSDTADVNIVLQWKQSSQASLSQYCTCTPSFVGTRRYLLHQHATSSLCTSLTDYTTCSTADPTILDPDRLADPPTDTTDPSTGTPTVDMGNYLDLNNFVSWAETTYPASNYALVIWDHGSAFLTVPGFRAATTPKKAATKAVSQDYVTADEIETWQIQTALTGLPVNKLDMIIFDCSLQGMVEVAYQVYPVARTMVCSEESPPGPGYPYQEWLATLKTAGQNACAVGTSIVQDMVNYPPYVSSGVGYQDSLTQSLIDLSQMPNVATNLQAFGTAMYNDRTAEQTLIQTARNLNYVQSYGTDYLTLYAGMVDAYMYAGNMKAGTKNATVSAAATNFQNAFSNATTGAVLYQAYGPTKAGSNGLSIYCPNPPGQQYGYTSSYNYNLLSLTAAAPSWSNFIQNQVQ